MKRLFPLALTVLLLAASMILNPARTSSISPRRPPDQGLARASAALQPSVQPQSEVARSSRNVTLAGQSDLGGGGLNADVWAHGSFAYVGTWSGPCPGTGVKIADISDPANPEFVGTLAEHENTSAED